jgi:Na+/proline symporter
VAAGIALVSDTLVALLGAIGWATFAAAIFPVLAIGLNWRGATREGAIVAVVSSLSINIILNVFSIKLPWGIDGGLVAFVTSIVLFVGVSLLTASSVHVDDDVDAVMSL